MVKARVAMVITAWLLVLEAAVYGAALAAPPECGGFVSIEELKPGDLCTGRTVFTGDKVEEFEVEILAIVRDVTPDGDIIIGRATGGPLAQTGIIQGMSGSPVYLGDRLVGALSFSWAYLKEPITGITPIAEMLPALDDASAGSRKGPSGSGSGGPGTGLGLSLIPAEELASSGMGRLCELCGLAGSETPFPRASGVGAYGGREMAPIAAPLVISGFDESFLRDVSAILAGSGLVPVLGSSSADGGGHQELVPGSAIGVQFIGGDTNWTAVGTLTYREGDRVIAFGHSLFNEGEVEMPLVGAYVHTLLPLQSLSFKYASGTEVVGSLVHDRSKMIGGRLGPAPSMIPLHVDVESTDGNATGFDFEIVRVRAHSSFFAGLATAGAISQAVKTRGPASVELEVGLVACGRTVRHSDVFYTTVPAMRCAGELGALMDLVGGNEFESVRVDSVFVRAAVSEEERWATIERVAIRRMVYSPGDEIDIAITLKYWQGPRTTRTITLVMPEWAPEGPALLAVSGAVEYHEREAGRLGGGVRPRSFAQLAGLIAELKPGNAIVVQLTAERPTISLSGEEIPNVPGRAALVMVSASESGAVDRVESRVLAQRELAVDVQVGGLHELTLMVRPE